MDLIFDPIIEFLGRGGQVLLVIMAVTLLLWAFIYERFLYYRRKHPVVAAELVSEWLQREDRSSWQAHRVREYYLSKAWLGLNHNISLIKTLVAACPLLGLLGTVTGMIAVFDVMAMTGSSNARLMASGISMATIPTMAGMVAALSGIYFGGRLEKRAKDEKRALTEKLVFR